MCILERLFRWLCEARLDRMEATAVSQVVSVGGKGAIV